jgi:hypothetical protein
MVRKRNFIIIVLLSVLLVPLPLYARRGDGFGGSGFRGSGFRGSGFRGSGFGGSGFRGGGFGNRGANTSQGSLSSLFGDSPSTPSKLIPAAESHGILHITLKKQNAEIYIDGRFIGLASDFNGTAMVSVPSGNHVVEFKYKGSSLPAAYLDIVPGSVTLIER